MKRNYPKGRSGGDDDGEVGIALACDKQYDIIRVVFQEPTKWIGLDRESAILMRTLLDEKIKEMWP